MTVNVLSEFIYNTVSIFFHSEDFYDSENEYQNELLVSIETCCTFCSKQLKLQKVKFRRKSKQLGYE